MGKRSYPRKIGSIVDQLMARRGYAQVQTGTEMQRLFHTVMGADLAQYCTPGSVRGGTLQVVVSNSVAIQELTFQKSRLLKALQQEFPGSQINDIRFRVG